MHLFSTKRQTILTIILFVLILIFSVFYFFIELPASKPVVINNNQNFNSNINFNNNNTSSLPWLSASGVDIVNEKGDKVFLKGINFGNWLLWEGCSYGILNCAGWPEKKLRAEMEKRMPKAKVDQFFNDIIDNYITAKDFQNAKNIGLNFVRLGFHYRYVKEDELTVLDEAVRWAKEAGIYVILNMHAAPGAQASAYFADSEGEALLWNGENYQQEYYRLWEILARRYKDEPAVAGFEILNEPDATDGGQVTDLYNNAIRKIRQIDNEHIIFLDGNHYAGDFTIFPGPLDPNAVYVFHDYTETLAGLEAHNVNNGYSAFGLEHNVPIMCNEFSMWQLPQFTAYFLENNINYAPWSYKGWSNPAPYVSFSEDSAWRRWIEELNKNYPTNLTKSILQQTADVVSGSDLSAATKIEMLAIINSSIGLNEKKASLFAVSKKYPADAVEFLRIKETIGDLMGESELAWLDAFAQSIMAMTAENYNSIISSLRTN